MFFKILSHCIFLQADSGGPVVYQSKLVGVINLAAGCAVHNNPDYHSKVAYYVSWIRGAIRNQKKHNGFTDSTTGPALDQQVFRSQQKVSYNSPMQFTSSGWTNLLNN